MFPTTVWDVVRAAGGRNPEALARIAEEYRRPVLAFIRGRGIDASMAEDLCQDVFVRLLAGDVCAKADAEKGRFRTLLCTVTVRVIQDWRRRQRDIEVLEFDPAAVETSFDRVWVRFLLRRALKRLRMQSPAASEVLKSHLRGERPDRNKLWIARRKLVGLMRREIALTCLSPRAVEDEIAHLSPYLTPSRKTEKKD